METMKILSVLVILLCLVISWKISSPIQKASFATSPSWIDTTDLVVRKITSQPPILLSSGGDGEGLQPNYYGESCPGAENIIQSVVEELFLLRPLVAPALLRLVFHDCFSQGCDASVLLDASDGNESEKTAGPNRSLKGFEAIEIIKSEVEQACPGVVSCADILVLATRDALVLAGGPHYDLSTGRRDSPVPFHDIAEHQLPGPNFNLSETLLSFASRGFNVRETVSLLGSHSIGSINCRFFKDRLMNFSGTGRPDPTVNAEFLHLMRSKCNVSFQTTAPTQSPSVIPSSAPPVRPFSFSALPPAPPALVEKFMSAMPDSGGMSMAMSYHQQGVDFGMAYYRSLLSGKGILFSDQQLTAGEESLFWVNDYSLNSSLFQQDFGAAMRKLSELQPLTAPRGQIRVNCSKAL